jgi:16S rRNA (guanine(966)-N(2))-methyltransferase RsmD
MRIIAGEFRSRKLFTPRDASVTRPIPDRVKESLFGLLRGHTEDATVFDAFAGTGAIGLEAISRGATRCVFVERDRRIAEILRKNIDALGVGERAEVVVGDALGPGALARCPRPVKLAFFDPPYPLVRDPAGWPRVRTQVERIINLLTEDGFLVLRTPWPFSLHVKAEGDASPPQEEQSASNKRRKHEKGRWKEERRRQRNAEEWIDVAGRSTDQIEQMMEGEAEGDDLEPETPNAGVEYVKPDLTFPNADGPETHVYHAMAVHLYAKKPS